MANDTDRTVVKLAARIEQLRRQRKMTQEDLAEKAKLNRSYFWDLENGRNMTVKTAARIAKALDVTLAELFSF